MAFVTTTAGDRYNLIDNMVPKTYAVGTYAAPKIGDLVVHDTGTANGVKLVAAATGAGSGPEGIVEVINPSGVLTVAWFISGVEIELPFTGTCNLGDKVAGSATPTNHGATLDRTVVTQDNTNGTGTAIAKDAAAPHGTGHVVVRF